MQFEKKITKTFDVKYLKFSVMPRYWEAVVNGVEGSLDIPLKRDKMWNLKIDIDTGKVIDWPDGTTIDVHYKVCDAGSYYLLDENDDVIVSKEQVYVPSFIGEYGDYLIIDINEKGFIKNWKLSENELYDFFEDD